MSAARFHQRQGVRKDGLQGRRVWTGVPCVWSGCAHESLPLACRPPPETVVVRKVVCNVGNDDRCASCGGLQISDTVVVKPGGHPAENMCAQATKSWDRVSYVIEEQEVSSSPLQDTQLWVVRQPAYAGSTPKQCALALTTQPRRCHVQADLYRRSAHVCPPRHELGPHTAPPHHPNKWQMTVLTPITPPL
jgi:hypothetical protein